MNHMYPVQGMQAQPVEGEVKRICEQWLNYHVIAHMSDGSRCEGIIDAVDSDGVTLLIAIDMDVDGDMSMPYRQPYLGRRRFRRFQRQRFPFQSFFFPFFVPFPYFYPPFAPAPFYPGYGTPYY